MILAARVAKLDTEKQLTDLRQVIVERDATIIRSQEELDAAKGRAVTEASRPMTSSRAGFVEAQGAGMQLLMDAELAIKMGLPIYAVVGLTNTATDREGRSVPAPGQVGHIS